MRPITRLPPAEGFFPLFSAASFLTGSPLSHLKTRPSFLEEMESSRRFIPEPWPNPPVVFKTGSFGKIACGFFGAFDRINNLLFPSNQGDWSTSLDDAAKSGVVRCRRASGRFDSGTAPVIPPLSA